MNNLNIKVRDLHLELEKKKILNGISLNIASRSLTALIGPSGSGKTTFLKAICGLLTPSHGEISFTDKTGNDIPREKIKFGFIFQDLGLFENTSVQNNITLTDKKIANTQNFKSLMDRLKLKSILKENVNHLSGGERQRVAIARSLVRAPHILLMDEPFSNIDNNLALELEELIVELHSDYKFTLLYVSHNLNSASRICDDTILMRDGSSIRTGTMGDLYAKPRSEFEFNFFSELKIESFSVLDLENSFWGTDAPSEVSKLYCRPEDISITEYSNGSDTSFRAKLIKIIDFGGQKIGKFQTESNITIYSVVTLGSHLIKNSYYSLKINRIHKF